MSPDSDVIGTNYDGTTAGKKRHRLRNGLSPRNSLDRLAGQPCRTGLRAGLPSAARAATTERVVVNRFTRSGHRGFRPRRLFRRRPRRCSACRISRRPQAGAVWRFRNEGNRASFVAHPEIYGPQFGGYDPVDLARGVTVAGNPRFWLVSGQRLYLFGREENRDAFAADPDARSCAEANARWPALEQDLAQ